MENVPIYVKVDKYKELTSVLKAIQAKLENADRMIEKINSLKADEDAQIQEWNENISDVKDRLQRITDAFHQG